MKFTWHWIKSNPTTWGLGEPKGKVLVNIIATTYRQSDGSWKWSVFNKQIQDYGIEPSRLAAIKIATKVSCISSV